MMLRVPAILLALLCLAPAAPAQQDEARALESLFEQGQRAFDEGLSQRAEAPGAAAESFRQAAAAWRQLIDGHGVRNGRLLYNIGNAHLLAGEVGPAIAAYRRAEQYIAGDRHLVANLEQARRRVRTAVELPASQRARGLLLFWHDDWSQRTRLTLLTILWGAGWTWALARLTSRLAMLPRWPGWSAAALALVLAGSLAVEELAPEAPAGVVLHETIGRKGPSEIGYEPSFTEPLAEGVEFAALEDRGAWLLARLRDGRETWLPRGSVDLIE